MPVVNERLVFEGMFPSLGKTIPEICFGTFLHILQECKEIKSLRFVRKIHLQICINGLENHILLGNHLIPAFVKSGCLSSAEQALKLLTCRNEHAWTSLVLGCAENGALLKALELYQSMYEDSVSPSSYTLMGLLKSCARLEELAIGQNLHINALQRGFTDNLFVCSTLIDMYVKCGLLSDAQVVFNKLTTHDVVLWTALLSGYVEHGDGQEALDYFSHMQVEGTVPNAFTFATVLKACGMVETLGKGQVIYKEVVMKGLDRDLCVGSALVDMLLKCGAVVDAHAVFEKLPIQDVVVWTALIAGYGDNGPYDKAIECFEMMQMKGLTPDAFTYSCICKACGRIRDVNKARKIHRDIIQDGFEIDSVVCTALIGLYISCGLHLEIKEVLADLPNQDVGAWNSVIAGHAEIGSFQNAIGCLDQMQGDGISPDVLTFANLLTCCGTLEHLDKGHMVHRETILRAYDQDPLVGSTLVSMYAKCALLDNARHVFDRLTVKDSISWTALITGYADHGPAETALNFCDQMQAQECILDGYTFACVLKACGSMGSVDMGRAFHGRALQRGFDLDISVCNSLVNMYAKCFCLNEARLVFNNLHVQDVVTWNSLLSGVCCSCEGNIVMEYFEDMQGHGIKPDAVTFTCLLAACSHANLVSKGQELFEVMVKEHGIAPTLEHCTCMIDLLGRTGHVCEAEKFLESIPRLPCEEDWRALLTACQKYGQTDMGCRCFEVLL